MHGIVPAVASRWLPLLVLGLGLSWSCGSGGGGSGGGGFGEGVLEEAGNPAASAGGGWWLSSGALFFRDEESGRTIQGELPHDSPWRHEYARSNPRDTDGGAHPQNLFRLVRIASVQNVITEVSFLVRATHASASPNRGGSNGVFLFQRYLDANNLYASGVRVDGQAVIKKKVRGQNLTLASSLIFTNGAPWHPSSNPNVLPARWIGLRAEAHDQPDGTVRLLLFVDGALVLEAVDDGRYGPMLGPGSGGIRGDFMDLEFRGYGLEGD